MAFIAWIEKEGTLSHQILCSSCWYENRTVGDVAGAIAHLSGAQRDALWAIAHREVREVNASAESACQKCQKKMVNGETREIQNAR